MVGNLPNVSVAVQLFLWAEVFTLLRLAIFGVVILVGLNSPAKNLKTGKILRILHCNFSDTEYSDLNHFFYNVIILLIFVYTDEFPQ